MSSNVTFEMKEDYIKNITLKFSTLMNILCLHNINI